MARRVGQASDRASVAPADAVGPDAFPTALTHAAAWVVLWGGPGFDGVAYVEVAGSVREDVHRSISVR